VQEISRALQSGTPGIRANAAPAPLVLPPPTSAPATGIGERPRQGTQEAPTGASTPTAPTYGATAVTAVNGALGTALDLLA